AGNPGTNAGINLGPASTANGNLIEFGNNSAAGGGASHFTQIGADAGSSLNGIVGEVFEMSDAGNAVVMTVDRVGDLGIAGALHQTSDRKKKRGVQFFDLRRNTFTNLARKSTVIRYCLNGEDTKACTPGGNG